METPSNQEVSGLAFIQRKSLKRKRAVSYPQRKCPSQPFKRKSKVRCWTAVRPGQEEKERQSRPNSAKERKPEKEIPFCLYKKEIYF